MRLLGNASIVKIAAAMTLFFAACKESAPPKSAANEKTEDANPTNPSPPSNPGPASPPSPDPDPCPSSSSSDDTDTDTDTDSDTDTETDTDTDDSSGEDPFSLTGKTMTVKKHKRAKSAKKPKKAKSVAIPNAKPRKSFALADTVSYDSDIKSLLDSNCTSCHKAGGDSPDLSSYSLAKSGLSASISQINSDKMPKSSPLSSTDKAKFEAWQSAGAPEKASDTSTGDNTDTDTDTDSDSDSDSSGCGSASGDDDEFGDGYNDLVNPPELEECKEKGKVYDRKAGECHKAEVAEFSCDKSGILAAFKKVGVNADSRLSDITGDGYEIDQCGIYDDEPIVYFTKQGDSSGDSVSLKIKKLCKPSASVCK